MRIIGPVFLIMLSISCGITCGQSLETTVAERSADETGTQRVVFGDGADGLSPPIQWKRHLIVDHAKSAINSAVASDFDGDGNIDVIASYERGVFIHRGPDWRKIQIQKN